MHPIRPSCAPLNREFLKDPPLDPPPHRGGGHLFSGLWLPGWTWRPPQNSQKPKSSQFILVARRMVSLRRGRRFFCNWLRRGSFLLSSRAPRQELTCALRPQHRKHFTTLQLSAETFLVPHPLQQKEFFRMIARRCNFFILIVPLLYFFFALWSERCGALALSMIQFSCHRLALKLG